MKKLAFCFLVYDCINQEEVWNIFFKNVDPDKYTIYIHYKMNVPLKYFEKYKLTNCIDTKYADISLVKAQNLLLEEALKDEDNQHFIFVSNSCIPLKPFDYIYNNLNISYSYFSEVYQFCRSFNYSFKRKDLKKSHQWCILNRKHTIEMLRPVLNIELFKNIYAADEHYYITNIYMKKLENEIVKNKITTTFVDWTNTVKTGHPKEYFNIKDKELLDIINSKHLFGRKFNKDCNIINNQEYINFIAKEYISTIEKTHENINNSKRINSTNNDIIREPIIKENINTLIKDNIEEKNSVQPLKVPRRNTNINVNNLKRNNKSNLIIDNFSKKEENSINVEVIKEENESISSEFAGENIIKKKKMISVVSSGRRIQRK